MSPEDEAARAGPSGRVRIRVEEQCFSVEKALLVESSEYFRALFRSGMRESTQEEIGLGGLSAAGFLAMLRVLAGERPALGGEETFQAVECAAFLQVKPLAKYLIHSIDSDNCLLLYHAAAVFGLLDLFHCAALYIRDSYAELEEHLGCLPADLLAYVQALLPSTFVAVGAHTPTFEFLEDLSRTICYLDEESNTWRTLSCLPLSASTFLAGMATMDNKIYIVGGVYGASKQVVESSFCYDADTDAWSEFPSPHQLRYDVRLVGHEGCLYAIGGEYEKISLKSVERYDVASNTWTFLCAQLPWAPLLSSSCQGYSTLDPEVTRHPAIGEGATGTAGTAASCKVPRWASPRHTELCGFCREQVLERCRHIYLDCTLKVCSIKPALCSNGSLYPGIKRKAVESPVSLLFSCVLFSS
uniref:Kelch repeat and BTB domain containing 13 n=1 Tax=Meleagris gallopavo TaxID=9103 RepID=G1NB79_MELGA